MAQLQTLQNQLLFVGVTPIDHHLDIGRVLGQQATRVHSGWSAFRQFLIKNSVFHHGFPAKPVVRGSVPSLAKEQNSAMASGESQMSSALSTPPDPQL